MAVFIALAVGAVSSAVGAQSGDATTDGDFAGETVEVVIPLAEGGEPNVGEVRRPGLTRTSRQPGFEPVNEPVAKVSRAPTGSSRAPRPTERVAGQHRDQCRAVGARPLGGAVRLRPAHAGAGQRHRRRHLCPHGVRRQRSRGPGQSFRAAHVRRHQRDGPRPHDPRGLRPVGIDVDAIFGFEGRGPVGLALQRGEIDIDYQTTSAYEA